MLNGRSAFELKISTQEFCRRERIDIGQSRIRRIVLKIIKRMEHEQRRLERMEITTSDKFSYIDYRDPTGESAVDNIMKEIRANTHQKVA